MKTCKLKPQKSQCASCMDMQMYFSKIENCDECPLMKMEYDVLDFTSGFWGTYAIITDGTSVKRVPIDEIILLGGN